MSDSKDVSFGNTVTTPDDKAKNPITVGEMKAAYAILFGDLGKAPAKQEAGGSGAELTNKIRKLETELTSLEHDIKQSVEAEHGDNNKP